MNIDHLIDKYFEGSLTAEEQEAFNNEMEKNAIFAAEVNLHKQLKASIHVQERAKVKAFLQNIEAKQTKKSTSYKWLYAAAAVLLIALSGIWVFTQKPDGNELFAAYYQPYPNTIAPIVRGEKKDMNDSLYTAFAAYENKNFTEAAPLFKALYQQTGKSHFIIYEAICLLAINKTNEALLLLNKNRFEEEDALIIRNWYMALAFIKQDKFNDAKPLLKEVSSSDNVFTPTAQTLLSKLP